MEKEGIIKKLLEKGIMVSPEELKKLSEENLEGFIASKTGGPLKEEAEISKREKEGVREEAREEKKGFKKETGEMAEVKGKPGDENRLGSWKNIIVNIRENKVKTKLSVKDVADFYKDKFKKIQGLISERAETVSINKLKGVYSNACVVGMVTELTARGFTIQDMTGSVEVVSKQRPEVNDVLGVKGVPRERAFFESEVVYPDIQINREIGKLSGLKVVLAEKLSKPVEGAGLLISHSPGFKDEKVITGFPNPGVIEVKRGAERVGILVYRPPREVDPNRAAGLLKKRHLMLEAWQVDSSQDNYFIEEVPDVFWVVSDGKWKTVYKGVLVVVSRGPVEVDFETKEVRFL